MSKNRPFDENREICRPFVFHDAANANAPALPMARRLLLSGLFVLFFGAVMVKLVVLGLSETHFEGQASGTAQPETMRPDLLDRNRDILATDIPTSSYYAEPRRIVDVDEAVEKITAIFKDIDRDRLKQQLSSNSGFLWVRRKLTPQQQRLIQSQGIPGTGFLPEIRRFYPGTASTSHILGHVDVDNQGIAGLEKYLEDTRLRYLRSSGLLDASDLQPVVLSIDLRVQHAVRQILLDALHRYQAKAAAAAIMDAHSGEILALVSLPDYDSNNPVDALKSSRLNRITAGVFELGSVMKIVTVAMVLESGRVSLADRFDVSSLTVRGQVIRDTYSSAQTFSVPEIFVHSSNIGAAQMALNVTPAEHQAFLDTLHLLSEPTLELPERAAPLLPKHWNELTSATVAYGYGVSLTPVQFLAAGAALVNGGHYITPTLFKRTQEEAEKKAQAVISEKTSREVRYLLRLNAETGSARKANIPGYSVGGKTGTAEKVINGRYDDNLRRSTFFSAFPMNAPRFVMLVVLDEPHEEPGSNAKPTAANNAAPTSGRIIERIAPTLGLVPLSRDVTASEVLGQNLAGLE